MLYLMLEPPDAILELAPGTFESVAQRKMDVRVALIGSGGVLDVDILAVRKGKANVHFIEPTRLVMMARTFYDHATSDDPPEAAFKLLDVPRNLFANFRKRDHVAKVDFRQRLHVVLPCRSRMTRSRGFTRFLQLDRNGTSTKPQCDSRDSFGMNE
jgi:hypothetical protein